MKIIIVVLFCFVLIPSIKGCDPAEISFEICKLDPVCTYQMYIDINGETDLITFKFLYNRLLYNATFRTFVESLLCTPNITDVNPEAITFWTYYMSQYSYCFHTNEYFDNFEKKCLCRPAKECHHEKPRHILFHFDAEHYISWLVLFITVLVMSLLYYHTKKRELNQNSSEILSFSSSSTTPKTRQPRK
jgi:hypothetical protein